MMPITTAQILNTRLNFLSPARSALIVDATELVLATINHQILQCTLTLQLSVELYQQIQIQTLFNLKPELVPAIAPFQPDLPISLVISLRPDLLPQLAKYLGDSPTHFIQLNQDQPDHPLFSTDSWFVLQVKQSTPTGEIGYRTFWDYVSPSLLFQEEVSSEAIADGLIQFFQNWVEGNLPEMTQAALKEVVKDFSQEVEEQLGDRDLETLTQDAIVTVFSELISGFDRWSKGQSLPPLAQERSLLQVVQTFFQQDGWDFRFLNREHMLQLAFQGKHGRWTCYAKTDEEQQYFVFYSIAPIKASLEQKSAIADFLTCVNYGLIIGNFELDINDGEIRYKTSINVQGDRLTPALIKQLVYTNVLTLDRYLPGIQAVIETGVTPAEAIRAIEQRDTAIPVKE